MVSSRERRIQAVGKEGAQQASLPLILVSAALLCLWVYLATPKLGALLPDADWYSLMASGMGSKVIMPFANRFLAPWIVFCFHRMFHLSIEIGFRIVSLASLFCLAAVTLRIIGINRRSIPLGLGILSLSLWLDWYGDYYLPDLFHAALLVIMLSFIQRNRLVAAAWMLPLLFLTRESTLLVVLVLLPLLYREYKVWITSLFLGLTVVGAALSRFLTRDALPNIRGMNDTLYMFCKVPWNAARNLLGIEVWANSDPYCAAVKTWSLPFNIGKNHMVGYCAFHWYAFPLVLSGYLTVFGIAPVLCLYLVRNTPWQQVAKTEKLFLHLCLLYGGIAFLISPALGTDYLRLMSYGWPAFFLFTPLVLKRFWNGTVTDTAILLTLHLFANYSLTWFHNHLWLYLFSAATPSLACWKYLKKRRPIILDNDSSGVETERGSLRACSVA
jgi:hypothetical protein